MALEKTQLKTQPKTLVMIRHAQRDLDDPSRNNGISPKGEEQVKKMLKFARNRLDGVAPCFMTSPKKRCVETLAPLAKELASKVDMEIDSRLAEAGPTENAALFSARIDEFLDHWKYEGPEVTVVCSHGDWIPIAVQKLTGARILLKKAGWIEIEYANGESVLTWLVQKHY